MDLALVCASAADRPYYRRQRGLRPGRALVRALVAVALLLPVLVTAALVSARAAEDHLLRRAREQLAHGSHEAAQDTLSALRGRMFLPPGTRRQAAALYFRLGEDRLAHAFLRGQKFQAGDPEDRRLRDLAARCQRGAALLERIDASKDPAERLRLVRKAREELPDAPRVLQRVVQEELLAMSAGSEDPALQAQFDRDYAKLRNSAPRLADEVKRKVAELVARGTD